MFLNPRCKSYMFQTKCHKIDTKLKCEMKLLQENMKEKLVDLDTQRLAGEGFGSKSHEIVEVKCL